MNGSTITRTSTRQSKVFGNIPAVQVILVASAPASAVTVDRCVIAAPFKVGRGSDNDLTIRDDKVSKHHFRISQRQDGLWIEDLGSSNGTFVEGVPVTGKQPLPHNSVVRAGRAVLVFHSNAEPLLMAPPAENFGMAGLFHAGPLIRELQEAALSARHILLAGPSGTGKELAARALSSMKGKRKAPLALVAHNAARFSSEEEAATTLFGVSQRVFSNVDARQGLIEQSSGGVFFLDEVHNLPERVQRSLLRVIEDGHTARIGETTTREVNVCFVLASNKPGPIYDLADDLVARLRVVEIPSLAERVADVPAIFEVALRQALTRYNLTENMIFPLLGGDHYEALCLDGFSADNVRGLVDIADRLATRIKAGTEPKTAVTTIFSERFGDGPVAQRYSGDAEATAGSSRYEQNKEWIIAAYQESGGNLSATARLLKTRGIRCTRRWLGIYLTKWGVYSQKSDS